MGEGAQIRKNSMFYFLTSIIRLGANMILFIGIARYYGPVAFGQFTTAHTYLTLFYILSDFGFDIFLTTEVARNREDAKKVLGNVFPLKIIFAIISIILMIGIGLSSSASTVTRSLMIVLSIGILGNSLSTSLFAFFKGLEKLEFETWTSFFQNIILLFGVIFLGLMHVPLLYLGLFFMFTRILGFGIIWQIASSKNIFGNFSISFRELMPTMSFVIPFGITLLFGTLFFQLDTILLSLWQGDKNVGEYQAVMKLVALILVFSDVVTNALLPVLSRFHASDKVRWNSTGKLVAKTLLFASLPIAMMFLLYADQILSTIYGPNQYRAAIPVMRVFAFILVVRMVADPFGILLTSSGNQLWRMTIVVIATFLNFGMNSYSIPHFGIEGAALTSLVTNSFVGLSCFIAIRHKALKISLFPDWRIISLFISIGIFTLVLWQMRNYSFYSGIMLIILIAPVMIYYLGFNRIERNQVLALVTSKR